MKKDIIGIISGVMGIALGATAVKLLEKRRVKPVYGEDKFKKYYLLANQWLILKQEGKDVSSYFEHNNIKKIAIYGMGELGNRLLEDLKFSSVQVVCAIDKKPENIYADVDTVKVGAEIPQVDAVIITAIFDFDNIKNELEEYINSPIIGLDEVVFDCDN